MTPQQRNLAIVTVGIVGVTALAAQQLIVVPQRQQLAKAQKQLKEEQGYLRLQEAVAKQLPEIARYQERLPENASADWLIQEVSRLAQAAEVQIVSLDPDTAQTYKQGTQLRVRVGFKGSYHDLGRFVSSIENAPKYIHIDEVHVEPAQGALERDVMTVDGSALMTQVRMVLSTLYVPPLSAALEP